MLRFLMIIVAIFACAGAPARGAEMGLSANGDCVPLCQIPGIRTLNTGTGHATSLFAQINTSPTMVVQYDGQRCYADMVPGTDTGINFHMPDGQLYHTQAQRYCPTFFFTPATDENTYSFQIAAAGEYTILWGDGTIETINKTTITQEIISHTYDDAASAHEIGIGGKATRYNGGNTYQHAAISFYDGTTKNTFQIKSMRGCLGCIFSSLPEGTTGTLQPKFIYTFAYNKTLTSQLPPDLFTGLSGAPASYMFMSTFFNSNNISGSIPETLFADLAGPMGAYMFQSTFNGCSGLSGPIPEKLFWGLSTPSGSALNATFYGCKGLTGSIPEKLFATIQGDTANGLFYGTFGGCSGLTGEIPENLFSGISGETKPFLFHGTFKNCSNLTGEIPEKLFADITASDTFVNAFAETFYNCKNLTGPSARINNKYLYELWPNVQTTQSTYYNDKLLDDYDSMPSIWNSLPN